MKKLNVNPNNTGDDIPQGSELNFDGLDTGRGQDTQRPMIHDRDKIQGDLDQESQDTRKYTGDVLMKAKKTSEEQATSVEEDINAHLVRQQNKELAQSNWVTTSMVIKPCTFISATIMILMIFFFAGLSLPYNMNFPERI